MATKKKAKKATKTAAKRGGRTTTKTRRQAVAAPPPKPMPLVEAPEPAEKQPGRDPRLPEPGTLLERKMKDGREIQIEVLADGFAWRGEKWGSLSAIAEKVSGTKWNGFLFFGLQTRPKKAAEV